MEREIIPEVQTLEEAVHIKEWLNAKCVAIQMHEKYLFEVKKRLKNASEQKDLDEAVDYIQTKFARNYKKLSAAKQKLNEKQTEQQQRSLTPGGLNIPSQTNTSSSKMSNRFLYK